MSWEEVQQGPAFWFTVVAVIVVFGPVIAERLRLPGLMGLLLGGALIGPNMLDVLPGFDTLDSVGSIGVLYLIFRQDVPARPSSYRRRTPLMTSWLRSSGSQGESPTRSAAFSSRSW